MTRSRAAAAVQAAGGDALAALEVALDRADVLQTEMDRLRLMLGQVRPPEHTWCVCGHEHSRWTATGLAVHECVWVFCGCTEYRSRPLPSADERGALARKIDLDRAAYRARRHR